MERIRSLRLLPQSFDGLVGSLGVILSSNVTIAFLTLGTLALTSQALSPAGLGLLVLIEAYGRMFDQILRLEPSQALIRMAMPHRDTADAPPFRRLVRFGLLLDIGGSVLAGSAALACLPMLGGWFGFDEQTYPLAVLFCLTLLIPAPMTFNALLRVFGRFGVYAGITVFTAVVRLVATGVLFTAGFGLPAFALLLCIVSCLERLAPSIYCWPLLRRRSGPGILKTPLAGLLRENDGLWRFVVASNLNVFARNSTRQFDVAALAGFLVPAELGFYVLAKRFAMLVIRLGSPMQLVVYPRMCELVAQGKLSQLSRLVALFFLMFLIISICGLAAFALIGRQLVAFAFGPDFVPAVPNILVQLAGASLLLTSTIINSALQAVHRVGQLVAVSTAAAAIFFVSLPVVVPDYGVLAASYLNLLVGGVSSLGCALVFARAIRTMPQDRTLGR